MRCLPRGKADSCMAYHEQCARSVRRATQKRRPRVQEARSRGTKVQRLEGIYALRPLLQTTKSFVKSIDLT